MLARPPLVTPLSSGSTELAGRAPLPFPGPLGARVRRLPSPGADRRLEVPQSVGRAAERLYGPWSCLPATFRRGKRRPLCRLCGPAAGVWRRRLPLPLPLRARQPERRGCGGLGGRKGFPRLGAGCLWALFFLTADASGLREGCVSLQNGFLPVSLSALFRKPATL